MNAAVFRAVAGSSPRSDGEVLFFDAWTHYAERSSLLATNASAGYTFSNMVISLRISFADLNDAALAWYGQ